MGRYQKIFAEARKNKKNTRAYKALEKRQKQNISGELDGRNTKSK